MRGPSPSPAERDLELIYLLAGTRARRDALRSRIRDVLVRADFGRLAVELADRRLLPLIGTRAVDSAPDVCPPAFRRVVDSARTAARAHGLAIEAETRRIAGLLEEDGLRCLPLKGPLLADAAHGDIGLRETGDVDLLVPRDRLSDAAQLLESEGYGAPPDPVRANGLPDLHLALRGSGRPAIELHWRVHWYEERFSEQMLARARPAGDGLLRADPRDLAASLLLYYARDGFHGVRLAADISAWWDRSGNELPPAFLEDTAREHRGIARALTAAATAVEQLTGAPARAWLGDAAATGRSVGMAVRLADWTQAGDRDQLAANISLVDGLLGQAGGRAAFVRRELVPRAGPTAPHAAKMLARYAVGLWGLRRGRRWVDPPAISERRR